MNAMVKPQNVEFAPMNQPSEDSRVLMAIVQKMSEDHDFDIDKVKAMIEIKRGIDADAARKAFNLAVAEFKRDPPIVVRDMLNKQYGSTYASIAAVVNTTNAALAPHGLNASWDVVEQTKEGMRLACVLSHSLGHEKRVELWGPMDSSGQKNPLQQVKSTMTYLKIATFEAVTGIASREGNQDDDGNGGGASKVDPIVAQWIETIAKCATLDAVTTTRKSIVDDYKGESNVPDALKKAVVSRKKELTAK
jgi:hypothetical protein